MLKRIVRTLLCLLAIISAVAGVVIITVRSRALDPLTYKRALAPSNLYREIRIQLEDILMEDATGEKQDHNNPLVTAILTQVKLPDIVVSTATKNIDNFFDWANQKKVEITLYYPRSELKAALENPLMQTAVLSQLETIIPILPKCESDTEKNKDFSTCKTDDIGADISRLQSKLPTFFGKLAQSSDFLDQSLIDMGLTNLSQETTVNTILAQKDAAARQPIETNLRTVEDMISTSALLGIMFTIVSLIFAMVEIVLGTLQWRSVLLKISMIYLVAGLAITAIAFIATAQPEVFIPLLPGAGASLFSASFADATSNFYHLLFNILFQLTLFTGIAITVVSVLLQITGRLLPKTDTEKSKIVPIGADLPVDNNLAPGLKLATPPTSGSIISNQ